jgi:predicted transcriptional regulator
LTDVKVILVMNEIKALIAFPNVAGTIDFRSVLVSSDPVFHQWCQDLFSFYWDRSEKLPHH